MPYITPLIKAEVRKGDINQYEIHVGWVEKPFRPLSDGEVSETFGLSNPVKIHFELKCMCIDFRMFFSTLGKQPFYRVRQWQQWCVGVPSGALTLQTGCQFLHTLLFWSTLKLGHFFLFNSDFKNSSYDTNWWKHQRNRWLFLWITYTRCSRPDGYGEKRNPEERSD